MRVESWTATFRVTLESDLSICKLRLSKKSSFIVEFSVVVVGFYALKDIYPVTKRGQPEFKKWLAVFGQAVFGK